jgi:nucleoside-diphosphate-sugar epimerase
MRSISILGSGWLGKPLGKHLVKAGFEVLGSTTSVEKLTEVGKDGVKPILLKFDPQPQGDDVEDFFQSDVLIISIPPRRKAGLGHEYLRQIEEIVESSKEGKVQRILLISSTSVYPDNNKEVFEDSPVESEENVMLKAENLIKVSGLNYTIIRFAGLVGPGRHPGRFFSNKTEVAGANCPVNLIHLEDCISIITSIIEKEQWNETFNACADLHPAKSDFYIQAANKLGLPPPQFSSQDQKYKIINSDKIKNRLNYSFKFPDPYQMI